MEDFYRIRRLPPYVFEQVNRAKAVARNSGADNSNKKREDRREEYVKRIQEVREGHKASNTSGLDAPRGGRGAP